jgi:hypothetical protein
MGEYKIYHRHLLGQQLATIVKATGIKEAVIIAKKMGHQEIFRIHQCL